MRDPFVLHTVELTDHHIKEFIDAHHDEPTLVRDSVSEFITHVLQI